MSKRPHDSYEERGAKVAKGGGRKGGGGKAGQNSGLGELRRFVFKVLCSDPYAANIIGKGGDSRRQIEEETGCSMWISKRDEFYPSSRCRLLILHADEDTQVFAALTDHMIPKLVEVAEKDKAIEKEIEVPLLGKEDGEYVFRCALPTFIRGKMIGTKGANIKQLREQSGAKIFVDNDTFEGHQLTRIIGLQDRITKAVKLIHEMVQEEVETEEYGRWAAQQQFSAPAAQAGRHSDGSHNARDRERVEREPRDRGDRDRGDRDRDRERDRGDRERDQRGGGRERGRDRSPPRHRGQGGPQPSDAYGGREEHGREREWEGDQRRGGPPSRGAPPPPPPRKMEDMLLNLPREFPEGTLEVDYAIRCDLPNSRVGALIGRKGENVREVEATTGTKINFEDGPTEGEDRYRSITITGPLLSVYAAHARLMQTYHKKEYEESQGGGKGRGAPVAAIDDLQSQIASLQNQLRELPKGGGGGRQPPNGRR